MSKILTESEKKAYIDKKGLVCPFCNTGEHCLEPRGLIQSDNSHGWKQLIHCDGCGEEWYDIYSLTSAESA